MNPTFCWQSFNFNFDIQYHTNTFSNHLQFQPFHDIHSSDSLEQLKKKCDFLVSQNSKLKDQIALVKAKKIKRKKKHVKRRKEEELDKIFKCSFPKCKKDYASLLALNLHIKKKHPSQTTSTSALKDSEREQNQPQLKQEKPVGISK